MREIGTDEVHRLRKCLTALAEHHNRVSVNFRGQYPKKAFDQTLLDFGDDLAAGRSYIAVTEYEGRITGFCKINTDDTFGVIEYLIVLEEFRGRGYGAALMEWAMGRFENSGVRTIDVKVADGNDAAALYEKYGFRMNAHILRLCR